MSCWSAYPGSTTSRAHGCCCCTANQHVQTTSSAQCPQTPLPDFAAANDAGLWRCLCSILQLDPAQPDSIRETATVPLSLGGLGLRSASRTRVSASADCLGMIHKRHPNVAARLDSSTTWKDIQTRQVCRPLLAPPGPSMESRDFNLRRGKHSPMERGQRHAEAASRVEELFRDGRLFSRLDDASKALMRSQGGVGSGLALSTCPLCGVTRLEPCLFSSPSPPLTGRNCWCGFPLDSCGHQGAACARSLGHRRRKTMRQPEAVAILAQAVSPQTPHCSRFWRVVWSGSLLHPVWPRRGWHNEQWAQDWLRILMSPRPPSVRWLRAQQNRRNQSAAG